MVVGRATDGMLAKIDALIACDPRVRGDHGLAHAHEAGAQVIRSKEEIWKKNGGEIITMSPDGSKRYIDAVSPVAGSILSASPKVKEDYEALLAAAKRHR